MELLKDIAMLGLYIKGFEISFKVVIIFLSIFALLGLTTLKYILKGVLNFKTKRSRNIG